MSPRKAATPARRHQIPETIAGTSRVIVERLEPEVDGGRFPIKRSIGEWVDVTADVFADGHDVLAGVVKWRRRVDPPAVEPAAAAARPAAGRKRQGVAAASTTDSWHEVPLVFLDNDRWGASFQVAELGRYEYTVEAWADRFATWRKELVIKAEAGQDVASELLEGAALVAAAAARESAAGEAQSELQRFAGLLRRDEPQLQRVTEARDPVLGALMDRHAERHGLGRYPRAAIVHVDPVRATFSAWYEMFPRSSTPDPSRSGTFAEAEARLPDIAELGFDVVYLPPIHPIGRTNRKGRNNSLTPAPEDPGSPWAIGAVEGGHTAIDPGLGTIEDFDRFVALATRLGLDVALDIAFQASPDHPWVREHPQWFRHRPDGSIKYAENPPKKYQDIYPLDFDSADWQGLWCALRDVFLYWASHGVTIFRVDNPHTKNFQFWEWVIAEVQRVHPKAIFLSEAFTRPKVMRYLAKAGFSQSYTYFTWRNSAPELREYLTELTRTELQQYMRPNFFVNTPDILSEFLQTGGRPAFELRLILAATLAASYGMYSGYELLEHLPLRPGSEEYLNSEKYEYRPRDFSLAGPMRELIARLNAIRREHPALRHNATLAFHRTDNDQFLFYSKSEPPGPIAQPAPAGASSAAMDRVFVIASHDVRWTQHGWLQMPIWELGIPPNEPYVVEDLLDGAHYLWRGEWNYVKLDPNVRTAHVLVVRP